MVNQKTLLVMRHAKSSWKEAGLSDFERPLNNRGRTAAPLMASVLEQKSLIPELVLASAARRAKQTSELLVETWPVDIPCHLDPHLYLAAPKQYFQSLAEHGADQNCIMVIGHNPGLEYLVESLTGEDEFMPTAAVAIISLFSDWTELGHRDKSAGELVEVLRPRDLE